MWKFVFAVLAAVLAVGYAGTMVGGFSDADPDSDGVRNALNFAVVKHNRGTNDLFYRKVSRVKKVQSQVVAGMKYVMTVEMSRTPCRKDSVLEVCDVHTNKTLAMPYDCTFTVLSQPWVNHIQLLKDTCATGNV